MKPRRLSGLSLSRFGPAHLARRWLATLRRPSPPATSDLAWTQSLLSESEFALWQQLGLADQAHTIAVARRVESFYRPDGDPASNDPASNDPATSAECRIACVAALLHDIGKVAAPQSASARVAATLLKPLVPSATAKRWAQEPSFASQGWRCALGRLLDYPAHGAMLLAQTQSDPIAVAWAAEHHLAPKHWTIDRQLGERLLHADQDAR